MKSARLIPLLILPVAVAVSLSGCVALLPHAESTSASLPSSAAPVPSAEPTEQASAPAVDPAPTESAAAPAAPAAPADGGVAAAPGSTAGPGQSLTYSFTNTDDQVALISAKLLDVTPATPEQVASLGALDKDDTLKGYNIVLIHFQETKVSGATVEFNDDSNYYDPIDSAGQEVSAVPVIGWDPCQTESFTDKFDAGTPITQCIVAAYATGGNPPAGIRYHGGYEDNNPYDAYDGKPLLFIGA